MMILVLLLSLNLNAEPTTTTEVNNKPMQKIGIQKERVIKGPQIKDLNLILLKATPEEKRNLANLLEQIHLVPFKKDLSTVKSVKEPSLWYREGIREGDIVKLSN